MKLRALRKSCTEDSGILMRHRDAHEALAWEVEVLPRLFDDVQHYSVLSSSLALVAFGPTTIQDESPE